MGSEQPGNDVGRYAGWNTTDEESNDLPIGRGIEPVRYLDDAPDDLWRDRLLWFFLPSLVAAITGWEILHKWFQVPEWVGWAFVAADLVGYAVIAWQGPALVSFTSRLWARRSKLA